MNARTFLCLLTLLALALPAGAANNPRVLKNARDAISYAKTNKQALILFALLDTSEGSRNFAQLFNDNLLKMKGEEFVVVLCDASDRNNQALFLNTFKQEIKAMPSVLITDPKGAVQAPALQGVQVQDDYDRMIHAALVAVGLRSKDTPIISSTTGDVIEGSSKVFQLKKSDVGVGDVVITDYRDWTMKNGTTFHGAVLKAEGAMGIFRLDDGEERTVNFNDLSPEDIAYLQVKLSGG